MASIGEILQTLLMGGANSAAPLSGGFAAPPPPRPAMAPAPGMRPVSEALPLPTNGGEGEIPIPRPRPADAGAVYGGSVPSGGGGGGLFDRLREAIPDGVETFAGDLGGGLSTLGTVQGGWAGFGQGFAGSVGARRERLRDESAAAVAAEEREYERGRDTVADDRYAGEQETEQERWETEQEFEREKFESESKIKSAEAARAIDKMVMDEARSLRDKRGFEMTEPEVQLYLKDLRKQIEDNYRRGYELTTGVSLASEGDDDIITSGAEGAPAAAAPPVEGAPAPEAATATPTGIENGTPQAPYAPKDQKDFETRVKIGDHFINPSNGVLMKRER